MNPRFSKIALLAVAFCCLQLHGQSRSSSRYPQGQQLAHQAVQRIASYKTIEAQLRVQTDVMGQPLVGSGGYAQLRATNGLLLRMELTIQAGGRASSVKQICNGTDLWEYWRIGDEEKLHHIDLGRVEQELAGAASPPVMAHVSASLLRGGLPKLLSELQRNFDFSQLVPQATQLSQVSVWRITGVWKPQALAALAPQAARDGGIDLASLPPHLPHRVVLDLGQSDLFPYRITYEQTAARDGESGDLQAVVTAEFYEVALNNPLDPTQFTYQQPDNVRVADRTDSFLRSLGWKQATKRR